MPLLDAVLLDRDGTVIHDRHYLSDPAQVELLPGAAKGMNLLRRAGCSLYLVTNQSGIGRGLFTEEDYGKCHARLEELLAAMDASLADSVFCPHVPGAAGCACRKPGIGMWEKLRAKHGLRAASCAMVGDKAVDIAFGKAAGLGVSVLVLTGKGLAEARKLGLPAMPECREFLEVSRNSSDLPDAVASSLYGAARFLLARFPGANSL